MVTFLFIYTWEDIIILLHFIIFKYYPFIDLVQMYYNFTSYIVLLNDAVKMQSTKSELNIIIKQLLLPII